MPYTTQQRKGHRAELEVKRDMEDRGCTVIKAGGSKGVFDLVAWDQYWIHFVQVKCNGWPGPDERQRMLDVSIPNNGRRFAANKKDRSREILWREIG